MNLKTEKQTWISWQERQREKVNQELRKPHPLEERKHSLRRMKQMLTQHEAEWTKALAIDLGKSEMEAFSSEIAVLLNETDTMIKNIDAWLKPSEETRFSLGMIEKNKEVRMPYGSMLILSPWNYPLQLSLMPVIGALAAGNSCVLKPSEFVPETSKLLKELIGLYFPIERVAVIEGDTTTAKELTGMKWDFIFFTGSSSVGKKVYEAAAKSVTPVLLELGGKNVCVVDESGMTTESIRNIVWGKYLNAGQTCVSFDIVYVPEKEEELFLEEAKNQLSLFYGKNPFSSPEYGKIITKEHVQRISSYFTQGKIELGGESHVENRYVAPTILSSPHPNSAVLHEEIFGPIMVIIPYEDFQELMDTIGNQDQSLVTYLFSQDTSRIEQFKTQMKSGTVSVNQVVRFAGNQHIPFGGVGTSGFGRYHGIESIRSFSYIQPQVTYHNLSPIPLIYPPYPSGILKGLKWFRKKLM